MTFEKALELAIVPAFTGLGTALWAVWKASRKRDEATQKELQANNEHTKTQLQKCEQRDRDNTEKIISITGDIGDMKRELGELSGKQRGAKELASELLDQIEKRQSSNAGSG